MQTFTSRSKRPWSLGKKMTLGFVLLFFTALLVAWLWFLHLTAAPVIAIPTPKMPSPNALDFYVRAGHQFRNQDKVADVIQAIYEGKDPAKQAYSPAEQQALVQENTTALQTLRQGLSYPYLSPPLRSLNDLFPYWPMERSLARLLALDAQVKAQHGDTSGAVNAGLDAVQMGEQVPHGAVLIGSLVGIACQAIGRSCLWPAVNALTSAQAQAAAQRLQQIQTLHTPLAETWQQEEWYGQASMLDQFQHGEGKGLAQFAKNALLNHYTDYMNTCIADARLPYAARPSAPTIPDDAWNTQFCPKFAPDSLSSTLNDAENALLMVSFALRAYRVQHGTYPKTLQSLVPQYLKAIPDDPFALSGPLRYKLTGPTCILYSVGPDGKDNGGKPIFDPAKPVLHLGGADRRYWVYRNSQGDIVAGINVE